MIFGLLENKGIINVNRNYNWNTYYDNRGWNYIFIYCK